MYLIGEGGNVTVYSEENVLQRQLALSDYLHLFGVNDLLHSMHREYTDQSDYATFLRVNRDTLSPLHSILEYNHRYEFSTVNNHSYSLQHYCEQYGLPQDNQEERETVAMLNQHHGGIKTNGECTHNKTVLLSGQNTHILTFDVVANTKHLSSTYPGTSPLKEGTLGQSSQMNLTNKNRLRKGAIQQEAPERQEQKDDYLPYLGLIFPQQVDPNVNMLMEQLSRHRLPCLNFLPGLKGIGNTFSFLLHPNYQWNASKYMSSSLALALLLYYVACSQREDTGTQRLINQSV